MDQAPDDVPAIAPPAVYTFLQAARERQAGLNLQQDLEMLNHTTRIAADPSAVQYLSHYIIFNGQLGMPALIMHTIGDGLVDNQDEQAHAEVAHQNGSTDQLRQVFVSRADTGRVLLMRSYPRA